jgi:hypothetical protein
MAFILTVALLTGGLIVPGAPALANETGIQAATQAPGITRDERTSLAREFLKRMRSGFARAEQAMRPAASMPVKQNILPEGEELLFEVFLTSTLKLDAVMFGRVKNAQVLFSFKDFAAALDFPIEIAAQGKTAQGWYIRENKTFALDMEAAAVSSAAGTFNIPRTVLAEDGDIFVPVTELEKWFNFKIKMDVPGLRVTIKSPEKLPLQERLEREKKKNGQGPPKVALLPLDEQPPRLADVPFVDIATSSRYDRRADQNTSESSHNMNIRTAGDFAYGTLTTQTQITSKDQIANIRANYKQESLEPDLLGPLKAKRFELGDVLQTRLPIDASVRQELGARITNADPLRGFTNPSTAITGTVFPGWDVELYRGNQFLGFQRTGDDGFYAFDNVILFSTENVFRVVFYGPQGEVREKEVSIPVDIARIAEGSGVYDVSLTFDNKQTYRKNKFEDEDEGSPSLVALYEKPLAPGTVGSFGFRSNEQDGERNNVVQSGVSTLLDETLINANIAVDDEADFAGELVARRNIGSHDLLGRARVFSDNFDTVLGGSDTAGFFDASLNANGSLPFTIGRRSNYNAFLGYNLSNSGDSLTSATLGFDTAYKNLTFSDQFNYTATNTDIDDRLNNTASVTGAFGKNRVRLRSDYEIKPESALRGVNATYTHDFTRNLDLELELDRRIDPSLTEASAQLNWLAGWGRISPSVSYNSDNDFFAGLNTNFGLARDPQNGEVRSFHQNITGNGGISVFVFLDENGDGEFNEGEQPLKGVAVNALQNGGRQETDENGRAFFHRVAELKLTDVIVEKDSLEDPYWIPGFKGASILPREGYVAELKFPIHIAGELDGTLYARSAAAQAYPLRAVPVHLYNADGEIQQTATTDIGGFYLFTGIPPGRYLLIVDQKAAKFSGFARPQPQPVEIGYEGTIIYGRDLYAEAQKEDIPSTVISGLADYKARHPHIDFENTDYNIALNLGEYNSRLLMSTVWYRLHSRYRKILAGGQLMVLPQHSYADEKTGKHTLRVGFHGVELEDSYNRCRALIAREISCEVEVLPAEIAKLAMGAKTPG